MNTVGVDKTQFVNITSFMYKNEFAKIIMILKHTLNVPPILQ